MKSFGAAIVIGLAIICASDVDASSRTSTSILDNCETVQASSSTDISLSCKLRTINSEFDRTNLSGLPGDMLTSLRLECSDVLFYQSSLDSSTLSHLTRLTSLHVEHCKLSRLPTGVFEGLDALRNLTIRTHNTAWPALSLDIDAGVFSTLDRLEKIDLSSNNIWTFPEGSFCGCVNLAELNLSQNRLQDLNVLGFNERKSSSSSKKRHGSNCGETSSPIEVLNVSKNRLILLPPNGLAKLGLLRELYLDGNEISIVSAGAFGSLALLKVLNLADNKIEQLPAEVFAANRELSEVYLQNNSLTTVNPLLFAKLDQMVILDLSKNKLTSDKLIGDKNGSSPFAGLIRLVNLNLAHNRLSVLKASMFQDLFSLQVLNLEGNSVATIEANAFADLKNLHTLSLSKNKLTYIDSTTLNGLFMLTFLSLDNNAIEAIHPEAFHNNSNVRDINLNGNAFSKIPAAIQNLTFLKTLDLGENAITELDSVALTGLPNLYGLRFTGNQITNVSSGVFKNLPMLKVVNLARNQINSVAPGTFDSNSNLQAVRLDANYLTDLNGLFAELPSLLWLNVSDNRLTWFDYGLIPQQLMWLDLHKNQITQLQNDYHRTEFRLQTLDASYNLLTSIGASIIPDSLENLYLNDNLLKSIEPNCFYNKVNLTRIDLFMNQLETLELSALALSPDRQVGAEVYMSGNPFVCDCKLDWIQRVNRLSTSGQYPMVMDLDNIYCQLPYHQVQKKEMEKRGRFFEEDPSAALAEVPHYFTSMDSSTPIVLPINQVAVDQFLCPYTSHCFDNCHCCDFEACDCQMTCPGGCQCYHDNSWTVNIVDCSAGGNGGQVAQVPLPPSIQPLPHFPSHVPHEAPQGGGGEASSSPRKTIPTTIPMDSTEIHLDGNQLDFLPSHVFIGRRNLERLYLNDSRIDTIMNNSFSGLRKLSVLHLEDNFLREIHGYEFEPLESLRELYLHGNHISFLAGNAFVHLKNLQVLTLSGNQISRFSLWSFNFHPYLTRVALDENPWSCDCDFLIQALPWIQNNLDKLTSLEEINGGDLQLTTAPASLHSNENRQRFRGPMEQLINPTGWTSSSSRPKRPINLNCVAEETGKSWSLLRLNASVCSSGESVVAVFEDEEGAQNAPGGSAPSGGPSPTPLDPSPFPYLPSILAIGGVLIFVSTVFFLVCFRRGRLGLFGKRSLAETCLGGVSGPEAGTCYDTAPAEDSDKLFDAYIAYSVKDEAWVSQILAQNIQQQNLHHSDQPYRLCLHYRDFVMTAYIADTIVEAVESSRRTIVVLSKNFLQSEWCSYEFKSALHTAIRGGNMRNRLVIVTLGDISTRDLDPDLRVMLRNAIVLQASDKLFWGKLKNTLPEPRPVVGGGGNGVASAAGSLWRQYSTTNKSVHSASTASYYDVNERNNWLQPGLFAQQQQQNSTSTTNTYSCSSGASPQPPPLPPMHHHPVHQHQLSGGSHQVGGHHQHQHTLPHHHHNHHVHQHSHSSGPPNSSNAHLQTVLDNYHNVQCNQMIQLMMAKGQMLPPQEVEKGHYSYVETA